ncbi:MAG: hypothetical protein AAGL98_02470 [Planctomycetota bacterium]
MRGQQVDHFGLFAEVNPDRGVGIFGDPDLTPPLYRNTTDKTRCTPGFIQDPLQMCGGRQHVFHF